LASRRRASALEMPNKRTTPWTDDEIALADNYREANPSATFEDVSSHLARHKVLRTAEACRQMFMKRRRVEKSTTAAVRFSICMCTSVVLLYMGYSLLVTGGQVAEYARAAPNAPQPQPSAVPKGAAPQQDDRPENVKKVSAMLAGRTTPSQQGLRDLAQVMFENQQRKKRGANMAELLEAEKEEPVERAASSTRTPQPSAKAKQAEKIDVDDGDDGDGYGADEQQESDGYTDDDRLERMYFEQQAALKKFQVRGRC
jgi:hypothetical protein